MRRMTVILLSLVQCFKMLPVDGDQHDWEMMLRVMFSKLLNLAVVTITFDIFIHYISIEYYRSYLQVTRYLHIYKNCLRMLK